MRCFYKATSRNSQLQLWACPLVVAGLAGIGIARSAVPPASTTKGFVVTQFLPAYYEGATGQTPSWDKSDGMPECPEGLATGVDADSVLIELKVPAAERERLKRPANIFELGNKLVHRGKDGADVCQHPQTAPDPGLRTVKGKIAYGLNLDGSDGPTTAPNMCAHENFVGPSSERGIDNQMYRALGCIKGRRQGSRFHNYHNAGMRHGDYTILIEITGLDDLRNDADVQVGFYSGQDAMVNNTDDVSLTHTSLRVHHDRHYHAMTGGKVENGVLTTEPVDLFFKAMPELQPYRFRDAQLRGELRSDGSMKAVLGGYQDIVTIYENVVQYGWESEANWRGPMTCPGLYYALKRFADKYPDTSDGQCGWISSAYAVEALPAFVIHPKDDRKAMPQVVRADSWWQRLLRR